MKVLLGEFTGRREAHLRELSWGRMWIARQRNISTYEGEPWGFDNGAYGDYLAGRAFDADAYLRRLDRAVPVGVPYIAVVPDIVAGGIKSLTFSLDWLDRLDCLPPWPWYLAVQDGMTTDDVQPHLGRVQGLFLGGSSAFKSTARAWCDYAHDAGLLFHYGRAGTPLKVAHALEVGADSLDSAFPMWTEARWRWFEQVVLSGHPQYRMAIA